MCPHEAASAQAPARVRAPVGRDVYLDDGWDEGAYGAYGAYDDEELGGDDGLDRAPPREYVESRRARILKNADMEEHCTPYRHILAKLGNGGDATAAARLGADTGRQLARGTWSRCM